MQKTNWGTAVDAELPSKRGAAGCCEAPTRTDNSDEQMTKRSRSEEGAEIRRDFAKKVGDSGETADKNLERAGGISGEGDVGMDVRAGAPPTKGLSTWVISARRETYTKQGSKVQSDLGSSGGCLGTPPATESHVVARPYTGAVEDGETALSATET